MASARIRHLALLLPLLLALGACSAMKPTAYAPATAKSAYGYKEQKLDENTWRVTVAGNSRTERELVENQLLYRAAEIALANGADGFVLLERDVERDVKYQTRYDPYYAYPYGGFWGYRPVYDPFGARLYPPGFGFGQRYGYGGYSAGIGMVFAPPARAETRSITKYTAYAEVRLYRGAAPAGEGTAYDARQVLAELGGRVNKPAPGKS
jgi:hypothetical protein